MRASSNELATTYCTKILSFARVRQPSLKAKDEGWRWSIQRLGVALHLATIGVSMHPDPEVRVCDTLDWYAPSTCLRDTFDEVAAWFVEAGLTDLVDVSRNQVFYHQGQGHGINVTGAGRGARRAIKGIRMVKKGKNRPGAGRDQAALLSYRRPESAS